MELINKVKTIALGSLAVGSGGVLYGYYSTTENKVITKSTKKSITKPSGKAYETCIKGADGISKQSESVCGWLYRGLVRK